MAVTTTPLVWNSKTFKEVLMKARGFLVALLLLLPVALFATGQSEAEKTVVAYSAHDQTIIDAVVPRFEKATGIKAQVVKLGSADVVLSLIHI